MVQVQKPAEPIVSTENNVANPIAGQDVESTPIWKKWWLWLIVVLVIAGLIIWVVI